MLKYLFDRQIGKKINEKKYMLDQTKRCNDVHIFNGINFGYAPHSLDGPCRFCTKARPLTFSQYLVLKRGYKIPPYQVR